MKHIRSWIVRTVFGKAQSAAPGDGQVRESWEERHRPDLDMEAIGRAASYAITCPCGAIIPVTIDCHLEDQEDGTLQLIATPDATDLWAHSFTHERMP